MSCTWLEFGIIVDENSLERKITQDYSAYKITTDVYKIIGVRFLDVATSEFKDVYSNDLSGIELVTEEIDTIRDEVDKLIGGKFKRHDEYVNADNTYLKYFIYKSDSEYSGVEVQSALPVYNKSGNLIMCCNTNLCVYKFSAFLEIIIDAETLRFDISFSEPTDLNRKYGVPYLRRLTNVSWDNALNLMKTDIDGVYLYNGFCFVYGYKEDSLILSDECRKLYITFPKSLKTIVFNKDIESIEDYSAFKIISVKTFYISKDVRIEFMCSFITLLIEDYLLARDQEATTNVRQLHTTITSLNSAGEYDRIWDTLNNSENKDIMQSVLSKFEIKVY
jgi:hypothetical protein